MERMKSQRVPSWNAYPLQQNAAVQVNEMSLTDLLPLYGPIRCHWIPDGDYPHFIKCVLGFVSLLLLTSLSFPHSLAA